MSDEDVELARLRWGCRRGMLELDLLLLPFVDNVVPGFNITQRATFAALLTYPEQELCACLLNYAELDVNEKDNAAALSNMLELIRAYAQDQSIPIFVHK